MKKTLNRRLPLLIPAFMLVMGGISSCNKSTTPTEEIAVTISNVAIRNFSLKADSKVMEKLDSVFFSIDLEKGVVFNADSLPKGTNITKLIPVITFASSLSEAKLILSGGSEKNDTINYLENSTDSIDFTRNVKLDVTAADGTNKYSYALKVNVHECDPDTLIWDRLASTELPSRMPSPKAQRSVDNGGKVYTLIEENDGSYTWAETGSLTEASWEKSELNLPFVPDVRSLATAGDSFYMLDEDGNLYESDDALTWNATGERWITLIGGYLGCVVGVKDADGMLRHCHYPADASISDPEMNPEFPLYARSDFRTVESKWTEEPTAFFVGGVTATGEISDHTWAFDGTTWTTIDSYPTPALEGASLIKYTVYRETSNSFKQVAYEAWITMGGKLKNGEYNRDLYISFDNGVNWREAPGSMSFPEAFPEIADADAIVLSTPLNANLADAWTTSPTPGHSKLMRIAYTLDGYHITWDCPYIYIMGGEGKDGGLLDSIWRGVIARLTFTPII